jgi:hypothetical protein
MFTPVVLVVSQVGTCVDYIIHITEGYLEASPHHEKNLRPQQLRDLLHASSDKEVRACVHHRLHHWDSSSLCPP